MALAAGSFIHMPTMLPTPNYKSSSKKSMTITIICEIKRAKAQHAQGNRSGGLGPGPHTNSILKSTTRNLQLDNINATNPISLNEEDHRRSPKRIANK